MTEHLNKALCIGSALRICDSGGLLVVFFFVLFVFARLLRNINVQHCVGFIWHLLLY